MDLKGCPPGCSLPGLLSIEARMVVDQMRSIQRLWWYSPLFDEIGQGLKMQRDADQLNEDLPNFAMTRLFDCGGRTYL